MSKPATAIVACPTCKAPVPWVAEQPFKPFCSQRCKLIDLGDWATEAHKIPGQPILTDFDADLLGGDE
ncbi:DNA gyrase inhibitor YacG [Methylomonas rivi]|uniref:DNA gyrase inhibitor YacG n=1 Tax=Methylomonas rivi TaxID=2952226 RepID=A0ABT1U0V0_9GAMM|nr:DNA gyrase inhibitor YacG [Methylomonas sp. WSC-6]MCQ8127432.1 DNA gyrase inhibitor YacG [Methylomonas sp. WSC-6]